MTFKSYIDIQRLKSAVAEKFIKGEPVVITEKLDGASAQIRYDETTNSLVCFSRRQQLSPENGLNGFYNFVQTLDVEIFKEVLGTRYILFGEWLIPHSVKYPEDKYKKFYAFDIYDTEKGLWLNYEIVMDIVNTLPNINAVPIFYRGIFTSWDDIMKYVGRTDIGAEPCGEGIVIKRQSVLSMRDSRKPYTVKIVSEKFSEVHKSKSKTIDPEKMAQKERDMAAVGEIVTERRIEKILQKLVEDQIIPEDWDEHDMKTIAKNIGKLAYEDCRKEEPETVLSIDNFGKICAQVSMQHVRKILNRK